MKQVFLWFKMLIFKYLISRCGIIISIKDNKGMSK